MRALITGATGFLGSRLAAALCARGAAVRITARSSSDLRRLGSLPVEPVLGDVVDRTSIERALAEVDVVFHAAALLEFGAAATRMEEVNVGGTENVLGAAAERGLLAIHVSSVAALGPTGTDPVDETYWNEGDPVVAYERTKRDAHLVARSYAARGAQVRIALPGGIYGYGDDSEMAAIIRTYARWPIPLGYLPEVTQSLVHVDDCADGLVHIADRGEDGREYVLVADTLTIGQWFGYIVQPVGRRPPRVWVPTSAVRGSARLLERIGSAPARQWAETAAMATRHFAYRGDRARRELEWQPRSVEAGMADLARRYATD